MLQTGDPLGDGTGGESIWGGEFEDEFVREYVAAAAAAACICIVVLSHLFSCYSLYFHLSLLCLDCVVNITRLKHDRPFTVSMANAGKTTELLTPFPS